MMWFVYQLYLMNKKRNWTGISLGLSKRLAALHMPVLLLVQGPFKKYFTLEKREEVNEIVIESDTVGKNAAITHPKYFYIYTCVTQIFVIGISHVSDNITVRSEKDISKRLCASKIMLLATKSNNSTNTWTCFYDNCVDLWK